MRRQGRAVGGRTGNDEWLVGRRYLSLASTAFVLATEHDHTTTLEVATLPAA